VRAETFAKPPPAYRAPERDLVADFERWWSLWSIPGTKRGKGHARRAYIRARRSGIEPEVLAGGVSRYMRWADREAKEPRFIKHPATWLNAESWADELPAGGHQKNGSQARRRPRMTIDDADVLQNAGMERPRGRGLSIDELLALGREEDEPYTARAG
jgi:hypothetical protein